MTSERVRTDQLPDSMLDRPTITISSRRSRPRLILLKEENDVHSSIAPAKQMITYWPQLIISAAKGRQHDRDGVPHLMSNLQMQRVGACGVQTPPHRRRKPAKILDLNNQQAPLGIESKNIHPLGFLNSDTAFSKSRGSVILYNGPGSREGEFQVSFDNLIHHENSNTDVLTLHLEQEPPLKQELTSDHQCYLSLFWKFYYLLSQERNI